MMLVCDQIVIHTLDWLVRGDYLQPSAVILQSTVLVWRFAYLYAIVTFQFHMVAIFPMVDLMATVYYTCFALAAGQNFVHVFLALLYFTTSIYGSMFAYMIWTLADRSMPIMFKCFCKTFAN